MDLRFSAEDEQFRRTVRAWLADNLVGEFGAARGLGGPGREHEAFDLRLAWDRHLAANGWTCLGWPTAHGGRDLPLLQQVIFHEEYARADAPVRVNHIGEELVAPTLMAFGTAEQQQRFLPAIKAVRELWAQGYSEPGAGSDLAAVATKAELDGDQWLVTGQKVWTSLAHLSQWIFLIVRTSPVQGTARHAGLTYLLCPLEQDGVEVRPIIQLTGTSEFNEVFFDRARTARDNVVGGVGDGWKVAMATLGFERGVSTIGQQLGFRRELDAIVALARANGALDDPVLVDRVVQAEIGLGVMRLHALRTLAGASAGAPGPEASTAKLFWASWHRGLGELAMDVAGAAGMVATGPPYDLDEYQRLFLFSRADTIYGGSDEIQRTIIAERVLGLPKEPRL